MVAVSVAVALCVVVYVPSAFCVGCACRWCTLCVELLDFAFFCFKLLDVLFMMCFFVFLLLVDCLS